MGMGLGDIFKAIIEELGEDVIGSATQKLFNEKKDEFPIPLKKPFWEDKKQESEVSPIKKAQNKKKEPNASKTKNPTLDENKNQNKVTSLEQQLANLQKKETTYEYLTSLEKEEVKRGIIMAEILGKPRCKQRMRRRV